MSYQNLKPETALRRANDMIKLKKNQEALDILLSFVTSKKHQNWTPKHEEIMLLFVSLAVNLRKNIKPALVQFRAITQQTHSSVFERIVREYVRLLVEATDVAAKSADSAAPVDASSAVFEAGAVYDDEVGFVFDEQLYFVNGVGGEDAEERNKRKILSPWLKCQWDAYRTVLDVVKNNNKFDVLYHEVVRSALEFCGRFSRTSDFKRLCEMLRQHLHTIEKYQGQNHAVNLSSMESIQSYLRTRFLQLDQACTMGLWNEALSIIEDISSLQSRGLALGYEALDLEYFHTFYQRLVQIFWAAENYIHHAYALRQLLLNVQAKQNKAGSSPESKSLDAELRNIASSTVLAALIVPLDSFAEEGKNVWSYETEDSSVLGDILQFDDSPTRANVIQTIVSDGILNAADETVRTLFNELEYGFSPFKVFHKIKPCLQFLAKSEELSKFILPLEDLIIKRLLQRLSKSYEVLNFSKLAVMAPDFDILRIERLIVDMSNEMDLNVRIDHRENLYYFSDFDVYGRRFISKLREVQDDLASVALQIRGEADDSREERKMIFEYIQDGLKDENEFHLTRFRVIEKRREILEGEARERFEREREREAAERKRRAEEEAMRKRQLAERRAKEKAEKERKERELRANLAIVEELKKKSEQVPSSAAPSVSKKIEQITENIETIDREELLRIQNEVFEAEKQAQIQKQKELEKRLDYIVRAERREELPKLMEKYEKEKLEDREYFLSQYQKMIEDHKSQFDEKLNEKTRLRRIGGALKAFTEQVMVVRQQHYNDLRAVQVEKLERAKAELEKARLEKQRQEEEAERKRQEEARQEQMRREAEEKKKQDALEKMKRADELAELRRKREEEIAQRKEAERMQRLGTFRAPAAAPAPSPTPTAVAPAEDESVPLFLRKRMQAKQAEQAAPRPAPAPSKPEPKPKPIQPEPAVTEPASGPWKKLDNKVAPAESSGPWKKPVAVAPKPATPSAEPEPEKPASSWRRETDASEKPAEKPGVWRPGQGRLQGSRPQSQRPAAPSPSSHADDRPAHLRKNQAQKATSVNDRPSRDPLPPQSRGAERHERHASPAPAAVAPPATEENDGFEVAGKKKYKPAPRPARR
eukprot:TRINITY_DN2653_c0_g1_i1.p1 TRINITY_DN2653_c0_g1~~TRINITY_DN2653_c0_g1_i1.p1  ORF type:complete len:1105 (+),score=363.57 TRINITY_DN2653_c0_g1_i1:71-3385(+)